jgi:hypothetical protein
MASGSQVREKNIVWTSTSPGYHCSVVMVSMHHQLQSLTGTQLAGQVAQFALIFQQLSPGIFGWCLLQLMHYLAHW